jgi:hypothetical protein
VVPRPNAPRGFARHELGILLPATGERADAAPALEANVYLSYPDLTGGDALREPEIVERLRRLSAADCLWAIAHLSTRLAAETRPSESAGLQERLVQEVIGDGPLGQALLQRLRDGSASTVFCEQQLVHLARLVILHADRRPHDDFADGALREEWGTCLIGVTDLLDADLDVEDPAQRLAWEIRQCCLNYHEDQLPVTAIHHEVYRVVWPQMEHQRARDVEDAFERHAGMQIADYFTVGAAVLARLLIRGASEDGTPGIEPAQAFAQTTMAKGTWEAFFMLTARDLDALRDELLAEASQYGEGTYSSLTFERYPLVEVEPGLYLPLSMASLRRRVSEGVFHILNEAAIADGRDRRYYSSIFGVAFQESVERTLRRGVELERSGATITADVLYGPRSQRRRSSDVILGYERNLVFVEVVSGPLQAATTTQGDLGCFRSDVDRLIVGKARQLDRSIRDFFDGALALPANDPALVAHAWPVLVTSHAFPHMDYILREVDRRIRAKGYLQYERVGSLAIVSAEELFFCEGFMEKGTSLLALLRGWKSGPMASAPLKNYLIALGGGRTPGSKHFVRRFAEANVDYMSRMLGQQNTVESVLANLRGSDPDDAP